MILNDIVLSVVIKLYLMSLCSVWLKLSVIILNDFMFESGYKIILNVITLSVVITKCHFT